VRTAGDHVHHRQRQQRRLGRREQLPQRQPLRARRSERAGDRRGQHGIRAEPPQVRRTVERPQGRVDPGLVGGVPPEQRRPDLVTDRANRPAHPLAPVAFLPVAALVRLVRARRRT
jgi:hypothetical protein